MFAWQDRLSFGKLASSLKSFQSSIDIVRVNSIPAEPFALTNKGVNLKLPLRRISEEVEPTKYFISAFRNGLRLSKKEEQKPNKRIPIFYMAILDCHRLESQKVLFAYILKIFLRYLKRVSMRQIRQV